MKLNELKNLDAKSVLGFFGANTARVAHAESFISLGLPNKKIEEYAYADIESYFDTPVELAISDIVSPEESEQLIVTDGVLTHAPSWLNIKKSANTNQPKKNPDALYHLSHIASQHTISLNIDTDKDLHILHKITKQNALLTYRISINIEPNHHVSIYETFEGTKATGSIVLNGFDIDIQRDSTLNFVKNQTIQQDTYRMLSSHDVTVFDEARFDFSTFDYGDASSLLTLHTKLHNRAHIEASHLLYANQEAKRGVISKILHIGEHSTSNQVAKNILDDKARGIFDALIKVENSARETKAHQNSKAILLKNGAYMASKPQLEIYIDELEASHGSTIGQLDEKELFYLRSRGISETEAKKMLIQAFANEIIKLVQDERTRESIYADFEKVYYGEVQMECLETCHGCADFTIKDEL